ncbi:metallopeptidase family protein [Glutamicibacter creatinolyticus]|uniref:metallopeptidase family protein n=1 Tax=Glutamicibacter creatinolyticus TaxID=162496 RepID=UPI0033F687E8
MKEKSRPPALPARRRRHGRGRRGPLVPMHLPGYRTRPERFDDAVVASAQRLAERWGTAVEAIDFRIRPVPSGKLLEKAAASGDRVPLASSRTATPGRRARISIYRLPIEQIAESYPEVVDIVHQCVVHELSQLWMQSVHEIDPEYFPEDPDM